MRSFRKASAGSNVNHQGIEPRRMNTDPTLLAKASSGQSPLSDDLAIRASVGCSGGWWLPFVGLVAALLGLPFIRTVFGMGDEGVLLRGAERMLQERKLYTDFFEFLPPGGFVLTATWFSIAGISVWSARLLAISTIVGIACFTYVACRQASRNAPLSAIFTIGWVVMSQGRWTQVSHHWFTTLFSMVGVWATLASFEHSPRWLRWPLIAGAAAGTAAMVTPTRGALAMLAATTAFLNLRRDRTELIAYVLGGAMVPAGLLIYLVSNQALAAAFDDVIRFTAARYSSIQGVPFGSFSDAQNLPLKYLFPLAALVTLLVCVREWRTCLRDRLLRSCIAFGLAGFVGCFPRPDITHIAFAAPLALPLLACCMTRLAQRWRQIYRYVVAAVLIGLCAPCAVSFLWISQIALRGQVVQTPRGGVVFSGQPGVSELLARIAATPPGDAYFFYPYMPMLPFLAAREDVSGYDIFAPGYTLPSQYQNACISVMQRASWVVIDRRWTDPNTWRQVFPAMQDARPQETKEFEQALDSGFEFVARDGTFELRRRHEGIGDTFCAGIAE
ncbi:MAG TPA: hypothetical protein VGR03_11020 [Candidatus Acidoferrum sp.]|nr:hypothetical protein [Candidatus Acidoferrum sp.]